MVFALENNEMTTKKNENRRNKMKWLEIIELRSVVDKHGVMELKLKDLIDEVKQESSLWGINLYSAMMLETDFSIHLYNEAESMEIGGSPLGQRLASALKEFGLVNHQVWIEKY